MVNVLLRSSIKQINIIQKKRQKKGEPASFSTPARSGSLASH